MATEYQVAALWIGGNLSFLEELCLKSFVDAGMHTILFTYGEVGNVPAGVEIRSGDEILPNPTIHRHGRTNSPALFSDRFRYVLLDKMDRTIWVDTDAYCCKPFTTPTGHFYAYEKPDGINGGVLGLPKDSDTLRELLAFTEDEYAIPEWFPAETQLDYARAYAAGTPVHASDMPWGVWGPRALTHFLQKTGEIRYAMPQVALYPVHYRDRQRMTTPGADLSGMITDETFSIHFYGRRMRARLSEKYGGIPRPRSLIGQLLAKHGIDPAKNPLPDKRAPEADATSGNEAEAAALLARTGAAEVARFGDIGGTAVDLALAAHRRWDCAIDLIDLSREGGFNAQPSAEVTAARAALLARDVPESAIRIVAAEADLRPCDLLATLNLFGDRAKIRHIQPVIEGAMHSDSRLVLDIRRGSGAFPFLKGFGSTDIIGPEADPRRVVFSPAPPVAAHDAQWAEIAAGLIGKDGFYTEGQGASFTYIPRDKSVLVVTFDNLDIAMGKREGRRPWGFDFIEKQGWSMLGVMAPGWTWYRDAFPQAEFDRLRRERFFDQFGRVVFYGASMGGYAAAAFSAACPGADVVAISPQSTLDRALVPWETRYRTAWDRDFSGPYGDAALVSRAARQVTILFDPHEALDAAHAARFDAPNVVALRCPLLGHRLGSSLSQMGVLSPIILAALEGNLTGPVFYRMLRARRDFPRYQRELFNRALARGHQKLARRLGEWVLARGDNRAIRLAMKEMSE